MHVGLDEWLNLLRREYLEDFVRDGGSAVKFVVVPNEAAARDVLGGTRRVAEPLGYLVAQVDAARTKVHLMDQLFHEIARQVPWEQLARTMVEQSYAQSGLRVPDGDLRVDAVAAANQLEVGPLRVEVRRNIEGLLNRRHELARDFRYAMLWLCTAQIARAGSGGFSDVDAILQWLRGELRLISTIKKLLIFRKIDRHNGRAMLSSLGAWCRLAGHAGLMLQLDMRQLMVARRADAPTDTIHYTAPAVMDAYEVLRQVIDSTDDLTGVLCVVVVPPELFDDDRRGVKVYKALYERVWPDVRLRARPNPLSALTMLSVTDSEEDVA